MPISNYLRTIGTYLAQAELNNVQRDCESQHDIEPTPFEVYSQSDENGLIQWITGNLGTEYGDHYEIEAEDGLECNSHLLLQIRQHGHWIDANHKRFISARSLWRKYLDKRALEIEESLVLPDNISYILRSDLTNSLDIASIDIDGNDLRAWQNIVGSPKQVDIEYNATFPPPISVAQPRVADYVWQKDNVFGASLAALDKLGGEKGYKLVACSSAGRMLFLYEMILVTCSLSFHGLPCISQIVMIYAKTHT